MFMAHASRKLTYAYLESLPPDRHRHELIDGEELMTPSPRPNHQGAVGNLFALLKVHAETHRLGRVFVAPIDVVLSEHDVVVPDVLFVSAGRVGIVAEKNLQGAPDLVIEVLSPSTASWDRGAKLELYSRAGVRECWLVDPVEHTVEIRELGKPRRTRIYKEGQSFESELLPGLVLEVDSAFAG